MPQAPIRVRKATDADAQHWDAFVESCDDATFFHRFGWARVNQRTFGHRPHYLLAERDGAIVGILPLAHKTSRLFGNALISTSFCSYGGVVASDPEARSPIEAEAEALARELGVDYLEFRNRAPQRDDWIRKDTVYATFRKPIEDGEDQIIKAIPYDGRRYAVRNSLRNNLTFEIQDGVDSFYRVFAESYRNLGTPVFPKRYFEHLLEAFGSDFEIGIVNGSKGALAASMFFYFKDDVHPYFTGGTRAARDVQANDFLYLRMMCRARERGRSMFDFGRSKYGTGSFDYKSYWGFTPEPLNYEYRLVRAREAPDLNPLNPKFALMIATWKRLPISVSKLVGPLIIRHFA